MMLQISSVVGPAQLEQVKALLDDAPFVEGKLSAGMAASRIKQNQEVDQQSDVYRQLNELVFSNLTRHPKFRNFALPHRIAAPFYARYEEGMGYGDHIDDPVMGSPDHFRTDVSLTVFLSEPDEYEGGELVIQSSYGEQTFKLPAGHAVLYPSGSLHRVANVTRGVRRVMVAWVQSLVRDPGQRAILYELNQVREPLLRKAPGEPDTQHLDHVYINLVRLWAEV